MSGKDAYGKETDGNLPRRTGVTAPAAFGARIALLILAGFLASPVAAKLPSPISLTPTKEEWPLLPEYCPDTQGFKYTHNSPNAPKWVALMGETFWALHHYCYGILKFMRGQNPGYPPEIRSGLLSSALGEFDFVIRAMPENYILAPEIFTYVGRTHLLLNQPDEAAAAFAKARGLKADYWPAYSWWAAYLAAHGARDRARVVATEGLKHAPNSKTLQSILTDIDSDKGRSTAKSAER